MKFKLLKASFFGLLLTISNYTHASLISFEFTSTATATEPTLIYEWTIDSSQPVYAEDSIIIYITEIFKTLNGIKSSQLGSFAALNDVGSISFSSPSRILAGGFELFDSDKKGFFVAEGTVLFSGKLLKMSGSPAINLPFISGQVSLDAAPDSDGSQGNRPLSVETRAGILITRVVEPSTLAIFVLGLMGLASRRFKKQS